MALFPRLTINELRATRAVATTTSRLLSFENSAIPRNPAAKKSSTCRKTVGTTKKSTSTVHPNHRLPRAMMNDGMNFLMVLKYQTTRVMSALACEVWILYGIHRDRFPAKCPEPPNYLIFSMPRCQKSLLLWPMPGIDSPQIGVQT